VCLDPADEGVWIGYEIDGEPGKCVRERKRENETD